MQPFDIEKALKFGAEILITRDGKEVAFFYQSRERFADSPFTVLVKWPNFINTYSVYSNGKHLSYKDTDQDLFIKTNHENENTINGAIQMKPFNKERAIAGDSVITRDGRKVTELKFFNEPDVCGYSIVGKINNQIFSFQGNGKFFPEMDSDDRESGLDLFMAPKKIKGWVAIQKKRHSDGNHSTSVFYTNKNEIELCFIGEDCSIHEIEIEV